MKHVRKSHPEPEPLGEYRARFARAPKPPGWKDFTKDPRRREPVKARLRDDQRGLCAYCENRLTPEDESVEHFIPRSIAPESELEWTNLLLCCGGGATRQTDVSTGEDSPFDAASRTCGHAKGAALGPILNPLELPVFPCLFRFTLEIGEIQPDPDSCLAGKVDSVLAEQTMTVLALRSGRLNRARLAVLNELLAQLAADGAAPAFSVERAAEIAAQQLPAGGDLPAVFTTIRWFLGTATEERLAAVAFEG